MLSDYTVSVETTILQAMKIIDKNAKGMIYVIEGDILRGVVTDGDIRRYLLNGGDLNCNVLNVTNESPLVLQKKRKIKHMI